MDVDYSFGGSPRFTSFRSDSGKWKIFSMVDSFMTIPLSPNRALFPENSNPFDEHEPIVKKLISEVITGLFFYS